MKTSSNANTVPSSINKIIVFKNGGRPICMGQHEDGGRGDKATQQTKHVYSPVQHVLIWVKTGAKKTFEFFQYFPTDNS